MVQCGMARHVTAEHSTADGMVKSMRRGEQSTSNFLDFMSLMQCVYENVQIIGLIFK